MFVGTVVVTGILAALLVFSGARKLTHTHAVVDMYGRVGVPERRLNLLAALLIAGALGVLGGLFVPAVGIAAAACLIAYFLVAIGFHVRFGQLATVQPAVALAALATAALVLRLLTA